jgi:acetylglutamate kinase
MEINVIKIGGNVIDDPEKLKGFLARFSGLTGPKILVHGGGKIATRLAADLGIESKLVEGRRITDAPMRDVVTMVYGGLVNKQMVAALQALGCNALGLSGADGGSIRAVKRPVKAIDYGYVGDVVEVKADFIMTLLEAGVHPVFAPLTYSAEGDILNTNADTQASAIAVSLSAFAKVNLVYCFEKKGVLRDADDHASVIETLDPNRYEQFKGEGVIYAGMIPKLDNAFTALRSGVQKVIICEADDIAEGVVGKAGTTIIL